jgi:hypothetical protein
LLKALEWLRNSNLDRRRSKMMMKRNLPTLMWIVTSFDTLEIITSRLLKVLVVA